MKILWQIILTSFIILTQACAEGEVSMSGSQGASQRAESHNLSPQGDDAEARRLGDSPNEVGAVVATEGSTQAEEIITIGNDDLMEGGTLEPVVEEESGEASLVEPSLPMNPDQEFLCQSPSVVLKSNESVLLSWQLPRPDAILTVELGTNSLGSLLTESASMVTYYAPDMVSQSQSITIIGRIEDLGLEAACSVQLQAEQDLGVQDDGFVEGLVGRVYQLANNTSRLPDFSLLMHQSEIVVRNLDIPNRAFDSGFPGAEDLIEWFGIQFSGRLMVATAGEYDFKLSSDDGANLYIDGQKLIDNDGTHAVSAKTGKVYLSEGEHEIRIDYFQGPRYHIALQLFWKQPGESSYEIISAEHLSRPKSSDD
ncbi:MAG: PA14 domain-containing protein [Oligoflexus sp.]